MVSHTETGTMDQLAVLRAVVGLLGERGQNGWWPSTFFGPEAGAFLDPVFARTRVLAQYQGVRQAAALVHDERIGVGSACHLFRLPEDMEQNLHEALQQNSGGAIAEHTTSKEAALAFLAHFADGVNLDGVGPVRVGPMADLRDETGWRRVAAYYVSGLSHGTQVYPYFTDQ